MGGGGEGQKFLFRRLQAVGRHIAVTINPDRMVMQPTVTIWSAVQSLLGDCHRRRRRHFPPTEVRTADQRVCIRLHYHSTTAYPENTFPPHCLEPSLPLTKNPNCVFLSD